MDRMELNQLKNKVMTSWRYIERVFDGGIEDYDQFQSFNNMCANHVLMCNKWCERLKPRLRWIQYNRMKMYLDFREVCAYTVEEINDTISSWQSMYDKAMEEAKMKAQLEERCRLEHEIALEYRDAQYEKERKADQKPFVGFRTSYNTPKKRGRKKKTE